MNLKQVNNSSIDFACYLAKLTDSILAGVFLDNFGADYDSSGGIPELFSADIGVLTPTRRHIYEQSIIQFQTICANRGVRWSFYCEEGDPVEEIVRQSRFADIVVIDPELSFSVQPEDAPSTFAKKVSAKSECPVIMAPYSFNKIDEIVFAYDGERSSVFAIKQFSYLFPELSEKKITVLSVVDDNEGDLQRDKIRELLKTHYSNIEFDIRQGNASDGLFYYLLGKKNVLVIMGAFGTRMLPGIFKNSTADLVIKVTNLPVFIAHH